MFWTTPRVVDSQTLLSDLEDDDLSLLDEVDEPSEKALNPPVAGGRRGLWRLLFWTVCSSTAIYTTKRLMVTHGYHYPLTITFLVLVAITVVYVTLCRSDSGYPSGVEHFPLGLQQPDKNTPFGSSNWTLMLPASVAAATSLPMLLEGILHMPSLPILVMLFPVIFAAERLVLFICCTQRVQRKSMPWEAIAAAAASIVVLYNEYRLMVPGLVWGVTGLLLMGVSRACFLLGSDRVSSEVAVQARLSAYHGFVIMSLFFGLVFSGTSAYCIEGLKAIHSIPLWTILMLLINAASFVGTAISGTSLLTYSPISFKDAMPQSSNIPNSGTEIVASLASSLLVLLAAIHSSPIVYVSWIQIAAYLVASACLVGADQIHTCVLACMDVTQQQFRKTMGNEPKEARKPSRVLTSSALLVLLTIFGWTISSLASASINSLAPSLPTSLDTSHNTTNRFDIVVSMYQEDPPSITSMLNRIKQTTLLSILKPRIILYTKDPTSNLSSLKAATGADIVRRLENTGREGGTYLWHIVNRWDALADQTMFIQAHAHNMRELIPRINSYLVPETGMLSLGFTGVTCACGDCGDRWSWEDKWNMVPTLYEQIYSRKCEPDTPILLSYKGQFVASAPRIRGISKNIYTELLAKMSSTDAMSHNTTNLAMEGVGKEDDSASNPYFGFTMERIWGLLMQCGTDARVAARCPSLLSGMGRGGRVEDCQCLDTPVKET